MTELLLRQIYFNETESRRKSSQHFPPLTVEMQLVPK